MLPEDERPKLVVFDLNNLNAKPISLIPKFKTKFKKATSIVGFLNHLQGELKAKAIEAGCDTVMPRSAFSQSLPNLLRRYGMEEEEDNMPQPDLRVGSSQKKRALPAQGASFFAEPQVYPGGQLSDAAAEQMDVEMIHGLAAVCAGVDDHAIAFGEASWRGRSVPRPRADDPAARWSSSLLRPARRNVLAAPASTWTGACGLMSAKA